MQTSAVSLEVAWAAFEAVWGWLPDGLIDDRVFDLWWADFGQNRPVSWRTRKTLQEALDWPVLEPLCSTTCADWGAAGLFLQAVGRRASQIAAGRRMAAAARALPYCYWSVLEDAGVTDVHRPLQRRVFRVEDRTWAELQQQPVWGCRCTVLQMSAQMLRQRGISIPPTGPQRA